MAGKKKKADTEEVSKEKTSSQRDITKDLIRALNKENGTRVAYNLAEEFEVPTNIKTWISTGCSVLDYIISNRRDGGLPSGRVIEIAGPPSCGKSHIAYQAAANTQKKGGIVVYIDTENATPIEKLHDMGIDVTSRFVYVDQHCTEHIFSTMETVVNKAASLNKEKKDVPILIVWDSVANSSPKAELEGEYEQQTMALQARVIAKGMRKIVGFLGENNVTLLCINQLKQSLVQMGDPWFTPGGNAIPFASSVRIRITSAQMIVDSGVTVGIKVNCSTKKNKITYPGRKLTFNIMFGRGTDETEAIHDQIWTYSKAQAKLDGKKRYNPIIVDGNICGLYGDSTQKTLTVIDKETGEVVLEKGYTKGTFKRLLKNPDYSPIIYEMLDRVMVYDKKRILLGDIDDDIDADEPEEITYEETTNGQAEG